MAASGDFPSRPHLFPACTWPQALATWHTCHWARAIFLHRSYNIAMHQSVNSQYCQGAREFYVLFFSLPIEIAVHK